MITASLPSNCNSSNSEVSEPLWDSKDGDADKLGDLFGGNSGGARWNEGNNAVPTGTGTNW